MQKITKLHKRGLAMLLAVVLLMGCLPATLAEEPEDNGMEFTGTLAEGLDEETLAALLEMDGAFPALLDAAEEGTDITEQVEITGLRVFLGGKEFTPNGTYEVLPGAPFSYEFTWKLEDDYTPKSGDCFTKTIAMIPGLAALPSYEEQPAMISLKDGRLIRVGTWSLIYDADGKLTFSMVFSTYANLFKNITGFKKGSGKFKSELTDTEITVGEDTGRLTVGSKPTTPPQPSAPPTAPTGTGWSMAKPDIAENKEFPFGKGYKYATIDKGGQIEWRAVFLMELQERQRDLLEKNKGNLNDLGYFDNVTKIDTKALGLEEGENSCYILEDTLDANQTFTLTTPFGRYNEKNLFSVELPILVPGTGTFLNSVVLNGLGKEDNNAYKGHGDFGNDYVLGEKFTYVNTDNDEANEATVKNTAMSYTVVKDRNTEDGLPRERLIINLGQLGVKRDDESGLNAGHLLNPNTGWKVQINKEPYDFRWNVKIKEANDMVEALKDGTNAPVVELKKLTDDLPADVTSDQAVAAALVAFEQWYTDSAEGHEKDTLEDAIAALTATGLKAALDNVEGFSGTKPHADWTAHYTNLQANQNFYSDNWRSYLAAWGDALGRYQLTKACYEDGQVFGFVLKYATQVTNTSVGTYRNHVRLTANGSTLDAENTVNLKFQHGVTGVFSPGSAVFKKTDSATGSALKGAKFEMYCSTDGILEPAGDDLGYFMPKDASASGTAYVWSHHKNDVGNITGALGTITELVTKNGDTDDGVLALEGLKSAVSSHTQYLVETVAPAGYYLNPTPIEIKVDGTGVVYDSIPNVARAVKLTKEGDFNHRPVDGAEFALYKKGENGDYAPVTGFTQRTAGGCTFYQPGGTGPLLTVNGELNIHGLDAGDYYLVETAAADGYVLTDAAKKKHYEFTLEKEMTKEGAGKLYQSNGYSYVLANAKSKSDYTPDPVLNREAVKSMTLTKVGEGDEPLAGAAFALYRWTGTEDDWNKEWNFDNDEQAAKWWGNFKIQTLHKKSESVYFTTENEANPVDDGGGWLTDGNGELTFENLPDGHYAILETKAPKKPATSETPEEEYVRVVTPWYFDVDVKAKGDVQLYRNPKGNDPLKGNRVPNVRKPGNLTVMKEVLGNRPDLNQPFKFTVTVKTLDNKAVTGDCLASLDTSEGTQYTTVTFDENGETIFYLADGEAMTIWDLPGGARYKVAEERVNGYVTSMPANSNGAIPSGKESVVKVQNRWATGLLRLSKNAFAPDADPKQPFEFTLTFRKDDGTPLTGDYAYDGWAIDGVDPPDSGTLKLTNGEATVSLKAGQRITVYGLPVGTAYTVTEKTEPGYTTTAIVNSESDDHGPGQVLSRSTGTPATGVIQDNQRDNVVFNNVKLPTDTPAEDTGDLTITKSVNCFSVDLAKEFTFHITALKNGKPDTTFTGPYDVLPDTMEDIYFTDGVATFTLRHQEYLTILGLPAGTQFLVQEEVPADYVSSLGEDGERVTIANRGHSLVSVTNFHKEGNLIVSKIVSGHGGDPKQLFTFTITLTDAKGQPLEGPVSYTGSSISGEVTAPADGKLELDENGTGSFELKHGQRRVFSGLPEGTHYTVKETPDDKYVVSSKDAEGTIQNHKEANARFDNTFKTGSLRVKKTVAGGDTERAFHFTVKVDDTKLTGTYGEMTFTDGVAQFDLKDGESKLAIHLPAGLGYTVTEHPDSSYTTSATGATGTLEYQRESLAEFVNTWSPGGGGTTTEKPKPKPDPDKPTDPTPPPEEPEIPVDPEHPEKPDIPVDPDRPDIPEGPNDPDRPDIPEGPNDPDRPDIPEDPEIPDRPDIPEDPNDPVRPDRPSEPDKPRLPQTGQNWLTAALLAAAGALLLALGRLGEKRRREEQ